MPVEIRPADAADGHFEPDLALPRDNKQRRMLCVASLGQILHADADDHAYSS